MKNYSWEKQPQVIEKRRAISRKNSPTELSKASPVTQNTPFKMFARRKNLLIKTRMTSEKTVYVSGLRCN